VPTELVEVLKREGESITASWHGVRDTGIGEQIVLGVETVLGVDRRPRPDRLVDAPSFLRPY
jgi:hypothetical protein